MVPQRMEVDKSENDITKKKRKQDLLEAALYLDSKCREQRSRPHMSNGEIRDKKTRDMLLEQYRKNKDAR